MPCTTGSGSAPRHERVISWPSPLSSETSGTAGVFFSPGSPPDFLIRATSAADDSPASVRSSGWAAAWTSPPGVSTRLASTVRHVPWSSLNRTGPVYDSSDIEPSGLAQLVVDSVRSPVTSIRRFCSRAISKAEAASSASAGPLTCGS